MPHSDKDPEYWFDLARSDEISARILARESGPPEIAAYHYHQAVEKLLKGLIARSGIEIPRIHDLDRLLLVAQKRGDIPVELLFDPVSLIQSYYADLRYPRGDRITVMDLAKIADAYHSSISILDELIK
jgi:HEPN domain-containing protein